MPLPETFKFTHWPELFLWQITRSDSALTFIDNNARPLTASSFEEKEFEETDCRMLDDLDLSNGIARGANTDSCLIALLANDQSYFPNHEPAMRLQP
jgi:hypothetical protein